MRLRTFLTLCTGEGAACDLARCFPRHIFGVSIRKFIGRAIRVVYSMQRVIEVGVAGGKKASAG